MATFRTQVTLEVPWRPDQGEESPADWDWWDMIGGAEAPRVVSCGPDVYDHDDEDEEP